MTRRALHRPAAITAIAIAVAALLAAHHTPPRPSTAEPRTPPTAAPASAPDIAPPVAHPTTVPVARPHDRRTPRVTRTGARAAARTFLTALLASERGRRDRRIGRAFLRSAVPQLARELTSTPARRPPGRRWPPPARVRRITVIGPSAGRMKAIAELTRAGRRSVLELELQHRDGRWRVRRLG